MIDVFLLVLAVLAILSLLLNGHNLGVGLSEHDRLFEFPMIVFSLLSIVLLLNIVLQSRNSFREATRILKDPPSSSRQFGPFEKHGFHWKKSTQVLISCCLEELEKNFRRFYSFHRFHPPYLVFYYSAKKGVLSLFAIPWIKTGFLVLLGYALLMDRNCIDPGAAGWVVLATALCFWIPGLLTYRFFPYRKLWLCFTEEGGKRYLTVTYGSPIGQTQEDRLCASIRQSLCKKGI